MLVAKDEWTSAAMTDDVLVVELLLRLKESRAASSSSSPLLHYPFTAKSVIPRWGLRLPRSKASGSAASSSRCDAVCRRNNSKKDDSTRCSPTTPLSWSGGSGGGSPSGTADGFEESSRPRSKGTATYESTSTTNGIKRARKKKSYDELKEEETSLLKERTNLRKEIATLQATFKEQRAKNEHLKRAKLDLNLHSSATNLIAYFDGAENAIASQPHQRIAPPSFGHFPSHLLSHATPYVNPYPQLDSSDEHKAASSSGNNSFVLPDLNMVPFEEDSGSEMLYGMS
ncbi:putative transcription factor bZIP family [Rosa chinensis]|uniref:Putative transcription factor bZIP family n=1 Tax=Rosa chinensis TaxID=74649 RepID=A0A2P6PXL3_ROSCH|nr:uncharacterized protein LOC112170441 [Rosa chinensis]PRQ26672.1 putative transcription factor bZIP family [Rosa chinensis]